MYNIAIYYSKTLLPRHRLGCVGEQAMVYDTIESKALS